MRSISLRSVTACSSDPSLDIVVKRKLFDVRHFLRRSRVRVTERNLYRDGPVLEITTPLDECVNGFKIDCAAYVFVLRSGTKRLASLHESLFARPPVRPRERILGGRDLALLRPRERQRLIRESVGLVGPELPLVSELSVKENVRLPLLLSGVRRRQATERAEQALASVGLQAQSKALPEQLGGLERQLTELARAAAADPALLLLDEFPRGLDTRGRTLLISAAWRIGRSRGIAILQRAACLEAIPYCDVLHGVDDPAARCRPG